MEKSRFTELERAALHQHLSRDEDGRALIARRLAQVEQLAETMPVLGQLLDGLKTIAAGYVAQDAWAAVDESKWTPDMKDEYQQLRQALQFPSMAEGDADERSALTERLWARVSAQLFPNRPDHLPEPLSRADASALVSSTFGAIEDRAALPACPTCAGRGDPGCGECQGQGVSPLAVTQVTADGVGLELERIETRKVLLGAASSGPRAESPVVSGSSFAVRVARESAFLAMQRSKARTQAMIAEFALEHAAKGGAGASDAGGAPETES